MLSDLQLRFILFLFGCIGSRLAITYLSYIASNSTLQLLGFLAIIPIIGWIYIIFIGSRDTGPETFGKPIWWKNIRPIHLILWMLFSYLAISKNHNAWMVLLTDTLFGLGAFLTHHLYAF
jgi:hypothetical protein